jgi:uncharacterized protein (TIGR03437 family)
MTHTNKLITTFLFTAFAVLPIILFADVTGADPKLTGAPGENAAVCTQCHSGTQLNGGGGSVKITMPGDATYTPGVTQRIKVEVSDPAQKRWGFELTARVSSDAANAQAGDLNASDSNTQVFCATGRVKPCSSDTVLQFITHTLSGTRLGTANSAAFEFDWTPPAADVGKITLYAAGNAANGNNQDTGDHIYTTSLELSPAAVVATPVINSDQGVVNAAIVQAAIAPNSWITISGKNLATTKRTWTSDEIASGQFPASLDNVSVTVNNKPAYVEYVSPEQVNILTPADDTVGPVEVRVTSNGQTSNLATATLQTFAPALFTFDGKHVATTPGENSLLDKSGTFFSASTLPAPVRPGDSIVLYGTGFGATDPAVPAGQIPQDSASLTTPVTITIGGVPATVTFGGLTPGFPQIYQFNVQVPAGLADGDQPVVVEIGGITSPADPGSYITVQN